MTEFALPENNEQEFIEIASRLGIRKIYFLYDFGKFDKNKMHELDSHKSKKLEFEIGLLVNEKNISSAVKYSSILVAKSNEDDRLFIESKKIKIIFGFEELSRKDHIHQRASGLNHITCELARKNNVIIGFSYSSLLNRKGEDTSRLMGRMRQNISLCKKYGVKTAIGSFSSNPYNLRSPYDLASLFRILGMEGKNIKDSLEIVI